MIDDKIKEFFPSTKESSYLFSAAVSPLHQKVYKIRRDHLKMMYEVGDVHWEKSIETMEEARGLTAKLLNGEADEIGFGYNTSYNMNILAAMLRQKGEGYNVVIPEDEFPSTSLPWYHQGFEVRRVKSVNGQIKISDLLDQCDESTLAVAHSYVQYATGFRQNLKVLGEELKKRSIYFIVNATQGVGIFPIDVQACHISALAASGHKWLCMGYGMSLMYMRKELFQQFKPPMVGWLSVEELEAMSSFPSVLKKTASVIELGVPAFNIILGFKAALEVVLELGVENIARRILDLRSDLVEGLIQKDLKLKSYQEENNDIFDSAHSANIAIELDQGEEIMARLAEQKIYTSYRQGALRISIHYFNTKEDIDRLLKAL